MLKNFINEQLCTWIEVIETNNKQFMYLVKVAWTLVGVSDKDMDPGRGFSKT